MVTMTTTIGNLHEPGVVIHGFKPIHNLTPVTDPISFFTLSGQPGLVCNTDNSKNCDIIAEQEMCLQIPMACRLNTKRILLNKISPHPSQRGTSQRGVTIETDNKDEIGESAIEEDSDDENWEDFGEEESGPPDVDRDPLFQRIDSKSDLTSRRSLLTSALHQDDRALALQNAASRSSPAIRCSRTSTPNGPCTSISPLEDSGLMMMRSQTSRPKPIIMTTSNVHPPAMSPKTTRRNMLASELTGSLRQSLLWERQQKNATTNAVAKRRQSAANPPILRRAMTTGDVEGLNNNTERQKILKSGAFKDYSKPESYYNQFFNDVRGDYNKSGW